MSLKTIANLIVIFCAILFSPLISLKLNYPILVACIEKILYVKFLVISFNDEQRNILLENDTNFYFSNMSDFFLTKFYQYVLWIENVKKKMLYKYLNYLNFHWTIIIKNIRRWFLIIYYCIDKIWFRLYHS